MSDHKPWDVMSFKRQSAEDRLPAIEAELERVSSELATKNEALDTVLARFAQVRAALAEVTRERDAIRLDLGKIQEERDLYLRVCVAFIGDRTPPMAARTIRKARVWDEDLRDYWEPYVRKLAKELPRKVRRCLP